VDWLSDWLIGFASDPNHPVGLAALFVSAMVEYVFPPFPGDTITLLGAVLITGYGWSLWAISAVVLAGSVLGFLADFWLGQRLQARPRRPERAERWSVLDRLVARFERHGALLLLLNRFVPGIRALFFVAAGMAGMRRRDVLLLGSLSVLLWNALLIALGAALGANLDALRGWMTRYTAASWLVLGGAVLLYLGVRLGIRLIRRLRRP
jgi:membrane protein DedA with SNARE-associated domain